MHEPKPPPPNAPWPLVTSFGLSAFGLWPTSSHFLSFPRFPLAKKGKSHKHQSTNDLHPSSNQASHKKPEKGSAADCSWGKSQGYPCTAFRFPLSAFRFPL